ncbi:dynein axonemal heavy chain 6 [Polistes fuscatus]|uniref:dynein axonemal heavy chain 6 n=1 Tax=Polistes fuscatus TaxID=30207 RepID=UPI001CA8BA1C|nr:dynein axonemal heavy chain 6 [Polistes fuscatus]
MKEEEDEISDSETSNIYPDPKSSDEDTIIKYSKNNQNINDVLVSRICQVSAKVCKSDPDEILYYIPHKKVLEKIESKEQTREPLTGFAKQQEEITKRILKPSLSQLQTVNEVKTKSHIIQVQPKSSIIDESYYKSKSQPPIIVNQLELIERLQNDPEHVFYYMVYAVDHSSEYFTPYALRVVEYKETGNAYLTISTDGVTQYSPEEVTFTPIELWKREYVFYMKLMKIRTFVIFRMWKAFYIWRKQITIGKFMKVSNYIEQNLFISDPILSKALLEINAMCSVFLNLSFYDVSVIEKLSLFDFTEMQFRKLEDLRNKLDEFRSLAKDIVNNACLKTLLEAGYTPDDSNITIEQTAYGKLIPFTGMKFKMPKDGVLKMSYIEQARKRDKCYRLSCFIHLIDFIQTNMMQGLLLNTYKSLVDVLKNHSNYLPDDESLENNLIDVVLESPLPRPQEPYFIVDLLISVKDGITMDPSENIFQQMFKTLQITWEENLHAIKPLLSDPFFYTFTRPMINRKIEKKICGEPPEILTVLSMDKSLEQLKEELSRILNDNINSMKRFSKRFQTIHNFYSEDMEFDENIIQNNLRCDLFRQWCLRYQNELKTINEIVNYQPLGIFYVQLQRFKKAAALAPESKRIVIEIIMPGIGKSRVNDLLSQAIESLHYLQSEPVSTDDFVSYIQFVDKAQHKVDMMENQLDYVKELYDTMEEFQINVPPDDIANYLGISVHFTTLRLAVDKKLEERGKLIAKFNTQLQKDIVSLTNKVSEINDEVMQTWLLEAESNVDECLETLKDLTERLNACVATADEYRSHQRAFKVEVTRFEMIDLVKNELKLRTLLWDSVTSWANALDQWQFIDFNTLNVEDVIGLTMQMLKNIFQMEKGLPSNNILPKLKEDVELIKNKLPILGYLRNPFLKKRHWIKIEGMLNYRFKPDEPLTWNLLENLGVFLYPNELMEIAAAASSEANLEGMITKVEDLWKNLEFIIVPYKEAKDVFILGSLEEIQLALDESNINIQTIAASRHVGPIKLKVEDWMEKLDLFTTTLDAWQYCQQQWLYLEAIFSAPDIQRQLPIEAKLFLQVDRSWKDIMRRAVKMPLAMEVCTQPGMLEQLTENNNNLDQVMKCLEAYLEIKRIAFPRFFFLSNDELLEILAQTKNPHAVQVHLQKCFDAIHRLEFATTTKEDEHGEVIATVLTNDIIAMISPEGEKVALGRGLRARGNVEDWLGKVEESMFITLRKRMKLAIIDLESRGRELFLSAHPSQIVLTVSQILWARNVHLILDSSDNVLNSIQSFQQKCYSDLNQLAAMVRGELPKLIREVIINLITIDVHARDIITILVENKIDSTTCFDWVKVLRYYWDDEIDNCLAKMSISEYLYGYEYLGAQRRLVITPLTDKCYLCLMGALQLDLGGAPAGPAGTGKTETTKDLAKAFAIQCVVFNCSEGLDYKIMGRFFSGLATSGAWCCFDEFNRIDIEVLSVIAQQLITIRNAKLIRATEFMFEGRMIKLVMSCSTFITMNPGYAGRTELPDNLKSLFRPFAMMVPDYKLIAEVTLYSEGFEMSSVLSKKMTLMYTLCSEQLSQQDHYDFGMRAVKSVLVMAGSLKRDNPDKSEDVVLIKALRDSNIPKFLSEDANLFQGIVNDLFPDIIIPLEDYGIFEETAITTLIDSGKQPEQCTIKKAIQLHETMVVRHGVMLVGPTGSGKSTVLNTLCKTYTRLYEMGVEGQYYQPVHMYILNPKAVTIGELYGEVDKLTNEWRDGLLGVIIRHACSFQTEDHQWVVCDGPVDAIWIENMNTVLDDNKMLCLANSERIKFTPYVHMIFEVMDLAQASPATVSRCGMVYVDPAELKWLPLVKTWVQKLPDEIFTLEYKKLIIDLFEAYFENGLIFFKRNCDHAIAQVDISKANMACAIMESIILEPNVIEKTTERSRIKTFLTQSFIYSLLWSIGGNIVDAYREFFELFVKEQFDNHPDARLPAADLWNLYMNIQTRRLDLWVKVMPIFEYDKNIPFFDIIVPTINTIRYGYIMQKLIMINMPVLFTGGTGVGKSIITKIVLNTLQETNLWVPITLIFSAQTSSGRTQEIIELKLEKRKKALLGAPIGKRVCIFVDDINMPKLDTYGSQPPIELLRQILDYGGMYDREKLFWKDIEDIVITAACAPPGGGRNPLTPRFVRHFAMLFIPAPTEESLRAIFKSIMRGFLSDFVQPIIDLGDKIINATVEVYKKISIDLLPTPEKSHYVFNLRDLSKCVQGMMQVNPSVIREPKQMLRLFYHECLRVFHDRLINQEDKNYFYRLLSNICLNTFGDQVVPLPDEKVIEIPPILLFGDFISYGVPLEQRIYEEITDTNKIKSVLQDYLDDYSLSIGQEMGIIFFMDAIEHICRLARILRSERGNGLLVGMGGMGKQSLTILASYLNSYRYYQIEVTRNYDQNSWFEDLRRFYFKPGTEGQHTTFIFTDTQIVLEEFLEDINNTLNTGEVPNLYEADELEKVIIATRPAAKQNGIDESDRDAIYQFFIERVRNFLHLMICMSPIGDAFRRRCRMFPSLVNCCTIDWFTKWPRDALLSVAESFIIKIVPDNEETLSALCSICVLMHETVGDATTRYFLEMRRRYYTTPSSYLELLKLYEKTLHKKKQEILTLKKKIINGLNKLHETNEMVTIMKEQLIILAPKLKSSTEEVSQLVKIIAKEQIECDKVKHVVIADEAAAKIKAEETAALEIDARQDLEAVIPALEEAEQALKALNKNDINEIRVFNQPPRLVRFVMEAVNLLLGEKTDWPTAKLVLGDIHFLDRLIAYPKDDISDKLLENLQKYVNHPDFKPELVAKQSKVCKSMCVWVRAMDGYAKIYRVVEPKRQRLKEAQNELWTIESLLAEKQKELADVERKIQLLQKQYDAAVNNLNYLENEMTLVEARLNRSGRLTSALRDEKQRWQTMTEEFDKQMLNITGDTLIASGALAYLGAFTNIYREELMGTWISRCRDLQIKITTNYNLINTLADPYEIRLWNVHGLPRDQISTENAIIVMQANRWPLMIDPQEQANRWIRNMEKENDIKICKLTDHNFMRILEACIRIGAPVLLEEVTETLDPSLEPVLLKQLFVQGGRTLIRLGDSDIEYDTNFRLYITTKIANPHYLPEICIKVTIVNFTVTSHGLQEQLLADVVRLERPDLEEIRNELIAKINSDKGQLQSIEDKILTLLYGAGDDILDNEELIETLNESKETSAIIATRLIETEATEVKISIERNKYQSVANRGSVLYFVVADLTDIDPMYQFSLKYFNQIFNAVIESSEKTTTLQERLIILNKNTTIAIYTNVARGLFEKHKLIFSLMVNIAIHLDAEVINYSQWNFILRGGSQIKVNIKPDCPTLTDIMWNNINYLASTSEKFANILEDVLKKINLKLNYLEEEINLNPKNVTKATHDWNNILSDIEKLMLLKCLKEECLIFGFTAYVSKHLGPKFVESPPASLHSLFPDTSNKIPLIFVLTTGSDPFSGFQRFAIEIEYFDRFDSISLGQGQGPIAEKLIKNGMNEGRWVFLQNCHLAVSWLINLEKIVADISEMPDNELHTDFRLFLSSMPSTAFPVSILQNAVKVTNEPPKGLKANLKRALLDLHEDFFEDNVLNESWRRMIFGICFFHGIIQERKKFGPLGWNILYEFSDSDRECCLLNLQIFCEGGTIPWDALTYITAEITYGGRVTDFWDLRLLKTILDIFFSPKTLDIDYIYSASGIYYCPKYEKLKEYIDFIDIFPIVEDSEIFGMHENANIAYQMKETQFIINTILEAQPKESMVSDIKSTTDIAYEMADMIMDRIHLNIDSQLCHSSHFTVDAKGRIPSFTTVLLQEVDRYNKLLAKIHASMENLQRAIKGFVVMSEELETVFTALINNQVPQLWHNVNVYPSLKTLGSWIKNLELRIDFIEMWLLHSTPLSFWISGLSFPQGFITGILQTYARKYNTPIDQLKLDFQVTEVVVHQEDIETAHKKANKEVPQAYKGLQIPQDGVFIHGLFIDAGRWDFQFKILVDANIGEMHPSLPVTHVNPVLQLPEQDLRYVCPLYKTSLRAGVLSTTGHSTNFVLPLLLPSVQRQSYWILKGTALLIEIPN